MLAERGAEQELVAGLGQFGGFAAHDLGDAGFGGERRGDLHRTGIAGTEQHIGLAVERLLHLRAGDAGVGLRIGVGDFQLAAEHAALGVDLLDREIDAVLPVGADGGAAAGQFGDVGQLDRRADCANAAVAITPASSAPAKIRNFIQSSLYVSLDCDRGLVAGRCYAAFVAAYLFAITASNAFPISTVDGFNPVNNSKASAA